MVRRDRYHLSQEFTPTLLKGIIIHPENALKFEFIIYKGDQVLSDQAKKTEYTKLIKYFLASLAVPDDDQWVNLSPYEKNRIIKEDFGKTEMGRDLLAQDYMLKQITASLIYPKEKLGQEFWNKVYAKAYQQFGTTNIPVNTFNKVWIVPDDAEVMEKGNMAYVLKNHLKVMLEEDYLSLNKHNGIQTIATSNQNKAHTIGSQVVREIVLPALEREVNEGKNFAPLRQVFSGVVLAAWYKRELKESFLGKVYMNKSRLKGIDQDPRNNQIIYQQYLKAFKKGVFNFIKEDIDKYSNETIPRKYFSGGVKTEYGEKLRTAPATPAQLVDTAMDIAHEDMAEVALNEMNDSAMISRQAWEKMFREAEDFLDVKQLPEAREALNALSRVINSERQTGLKVNRYRLLENRYINEKSDICKAAIKAKELGKAWTRINEFSSGSDIYQELMNSYWLARMGPIEELIDRENFTDSGNELEEVEVFLKKGNNRTYFPEVERAKRNLWGKYTAIKAGVVRREIKAKEFGKAWARINEFSSGSGIYQELIRVYWFAKLELVEAAINLNKFPEAKVILDEVSAFCGGVHRSDFNL